MNILHGIAAATLFKETFDIKQEDLLIFNDILSCGALKEYTDIEDWKVFRERSWKDMNASIFNDKSGFDGFERDFYTHFEAFKSADEYKLWIGTGLGDQLLLAFVVHLIEYYGLGIQKLSVYQFETLKRKHFDIEVFGIALLRTEDMLNHPSPYVLTDKQIAVAKSAWEAITVPTPEKYLQHLHGDIDNLFLLTKSMGFLFLRYPDINTGLPYWDKVLLKYTKKQEPKAARIIGDVLGYEYYDKYNLDIVGDDYLLSRLKNLANSNLKIPLVKVNNFDLPLKKTEIHILPDGIKALSGELNMIKENGINDWVCGVHLDSSSGGIWVRDGKELKWETFYTK